MTMKKINVVGTSGSGKTTFAKQLATVLKYPFIEMDQIYWGKNWSEQSDEAFFAKLNKQLASETWVLDGNYTRTIPTKWQNVDTLIWLDMGFFRTVFRAIKRAFSRAMSQQELWPDTGNTETWRQLFSRKSMIWWTLKYYHINKAKYAKIFNDPKYQHLNKIRLKSPKACQQLLLHTSTQ